VVVDPAGHRAMVRTAFTEQAATFEDPSLNVAFVSGLPWLLDLAAPSPDDVCLDVAAGTGLVARALAQRAARVVAVDITPAMVRAGAQQARREGVDVAFVLGDATALPVTSAACSLVLTRFSLHHLEEPAPLLREMVRVCRAGGRLVVKDLVASPVPALAREQDRVENLRDPSHLRMPIQGSVGDWLRDLGLEVTRQELASVHRPVEQWLRQAVTPGPAAAQVRAAFEADLAGGVPTGLRPSRSQGELWFTQDWEVTVAVRP
jgi:SAM-dependent methyltransferase